MKKRINSNLDVMLVNRYGITVKKCCASCQHKCLDDFAHRTCGLTGHKVRGKNKCGEWQMSEQLEMMGCERGKVQRREYQLTLLEVRASESLAMQRGLNITPKRLEDIQQDFETEHGSRFLIQ